MIMIKKYFSKILIILWKDIKGELRTKETLSSMIVFGILVLVIFNFSFDFSRDTALSTAPGVLWVAILFSSILGLNRTFTTEKESNAMQGILLTPIDKGAFYIGKLLGIIVFMIVFEIILLPFFTLFFNLSLFLYLPKLTGVILLGTLGICSVGTILSAVSINTRMREVMLPLLLFPVIIPVVIGAVNATGIILRQESQSGLMDWVRLLVFFDVLYTVVSYFLFEYVVTE